MKTEEHLHQLLQEARIETTAEADRDILAPARQCLRRFPSPERRSLRRAWLRVAAILLVLLGIGAWWFGSSRQTPPSKPVAITPAPAPGRAVSLRSLHRACRHGGIDALEAHLDRALTLVGPRPTALLEEVLSQPPHES
jgi:hypothetical protein